MRLSELYINSLGVFLPEPVEARVAVLAGLYDDEIRQESGFERTHVSSDISAVDMAVAAGKDAIARGSIDPAAIDYFAHGGAYYQGPLGWPATGYIMNGVGLGEIASVEVKQECNGMMAALDVAIGQLTGSAAKVNALVTGAANYSTPLIDRWRELGPQSILADGAAAVLVSRSHGFAELLSLNSATLPMAEGWGRGSEPLLPPQDHASGRLDMMQRAVDYTIETGTPMQVWLDAISGQVRDLSLLSLSEAKVDVSEVVRVVTGHEARYAVEESILRPLEIPIERSNWSSGKTIGHIGPCDYFISFDQLLRRGELSVGDIVLIVSQGAGWSTTTAVLRILDIPRWAHQEEQTSGSS